jgi:hypothetical protein
VFGELDVVFDLLVGNDAPNEREVRPVLVLEQLSAGRRGARVMRPVSIAIGNTPVFEAERLELAPVVSESPRATSV